MYGFQMNLDFISPLYFFKHCLDFQTEGSEYRWYSYGKSHMTMETIQNQKLPTDKRLYFHNNSKVNSNFIFKLDFTVLKLPLKKY